MAKQKEIAFSNQLAEICALMDQTRKDYTWNLQEISDCEKLTQDLLHRLELEDLTYNERAKLATELRDCRRRRRNLKNQVEIMEPLAQFLSTDLGHSGLKQLKEALGKTRKAEDRQSLRCYQPRILDMEPIFSARKKEA